MERVLKIWIYAISLSLIFTIFAGMAYATSNNSTAPLLYVCNNGGGNISVVDLKTDNVTASIDRASVPFSAVISPDGSRLYVVNEFSGTVSAINTSIGGLDGTVRIGFGPHFIAMDANGTKAFVLCGPEVVVFDTSTLNVTDRVWTPAMAPAGIAVTPDGKRAFVPDMGDNRVLIIGVPTGRSQAKVDGMPFAVTVSPDGKLAYVAIIGRDSWDKLNSRPTPQPSFPDSLITALIRWITGSGKEYNDVCIMDAMTGSILSNITVEGVPWGITSSPDGKHVYVACGEGESSFVSVLDMQDRVVTDRISIPINMMYTGLPASLAVSPDGAFLFVAHGNENAVAKINLKDRTVKKIAAGKELNGISTAPASISIVPDGSTIYVVNSRDNTVSEIDTASGTIKNTLRLWWYPENIAFTPDGSLAYVTNEYGDSVTVIDARSNRIMSDITVGDSPKGVAVSPDGKTAYVTNYQGKTVSIIDVKTNAVVNTIDGGNFPSGVAFSPDGRYAYIVTNQPNPLMAIDTMNPGSKPHSFDAGMSGYFPGGIVVSPDGSRIYVTSQNISGNNGSVWIFDAQKRALIDTIDVGGDPEGIAINHNGSCLYVANRRDNSLSIVDVNTGKAIANVILDGYQANGVVISDDDSKVYVTHNTLYSRVSVIDTSTQTVISSIEAGDGSMGLAIKPDK